MASQTSLLGAAGEYHVMSELLRRGYIAALAPRGVPNADIVVADLTGAQLCSIQVKARRDIGSDGGWHMHAKHEKNRSERLFFCFVDFGQKVSDRPKLFLVPSGIVADVLTASHKRWLQNPGRKGAPHKDGPMRRFLPDYRHLFGDKENPYPQGWLSKYLDAWSILGLEPTDASLETNGG